MEIDGFYNLHVLMIDKDDLFYVVTGSMRFCDEDHFGYWCMYEVEDGVHVRLRIPKSTVLTAVATI